jgi:aldose 1-epimerase
LTTNLRPAGQLITLQNRYGMRVTISEHGAAPVSWWAADRYGRLADVLLDCRDARAVRWQGEASGPHATFRLDSLDNSAGLPVKFEITVDYQLYDDGSLAIEYRAVADAPMPLIHASHPCFNLNGGRGDVGDHMLQIDADGYLDIDGDGNPVAVAAVGGTAFDFRKPAAIGPRLRWPDDQLRLAGGFDHCYCIETGPGRRGALCEVARVCDPGSGRRLNVSTTEAGLRFYSGNRLESVRGQGSQPYGRHAGFCLEPGAVPLPSDGGQDSAVVLRPGQVVRQTTVYRLSLQA